MAFLIRALALVFLWGLSQRRQQHTADLARIMDRLSTSQRSALLWEMTKDGRLPIATRAISAIPAIYMLSPIDLIPDFVPFFGHIDDGVLFNIVSDLLLRLTPRAEIERHLAALRDR
jgi:uncharacterized membrane protein YkvA (DUF1232 family)